MKKVIFLFIFSFVFMIQAYNQDVVPEQTEELASVQVIDKVFDEVTNAIESLAKALEVPAEHVYKILVKQQFINSISNILVIIISFLVFHLILIYSFRDYIKTNEKYRKMYDRSEDYIHYDLDESWWLFSIIPSIIIIIVTFIFLICSFENIITGFANPEYGAIKDIINAL